MITTIKRFLLSHTIIKNISVLAISNIINQLIQLLVLIKLTQTFTPQLLGIYSLLQTQIIIFSVIGSLGLKNVIIRNIARNNHLVKKSLINGFFLRMIGFVFSFILLIIYYNNFPHYDSILLLLVALIILLTSLNDLFESVFNGIERMEFISLINIFGTSLWFILISNPSHNLLTIYYVIICLALCTFTRSITYCIVFVRAKLLHDFEFKFFTFRDLKEFIYDSSSYYFIAVLTLVSNQIPLLFLELNSGLSQLGFYILTNKILLPYNMVIAVILTSIFPNLSKLYLSNFELFVTYIKSFIKYFTIIGTTVALILNLFRYEFINFLFGKDYIEISDIFIYHLWYIVLYALVCLIGTILNSMNKHKKLANLALICSIVQALTLWFCSGLGAKLFSAAFFAITIIVCILHAITLIRCIKKCINIRFYYKIGIVLFFGVITSFTLPQEFIFSVKLLIVVILITSMIILSHKSIKYHITK